MEKNAASCAK